MTRPQGAAFVAAASKERGMTTATQSQETRDSITAMRTVFEDRWQLLMRDVARFKNESAPSQVPSKRFYKIDRTLEELATLLVDEINGDAEEESLTRVTEAIWYEIEERLIAWAIVIHAGRERYRREHIEPQLV